MTATFMFATGIENSIPTLDGGRSRVDQMESSGHYLHWRRDFELVEEPGIRFLRYGPPLHSTLTGTGRYHWCFADVTLVYLRQKDITPIADLCHFGVPDGLGNFQIPDFPAQFATYAREFALRYPWIQLYTPVNEMYICATFSSPYGWWNEQLRGDAAFVTALKHLVKANVLRVRNDGIPSVGFTWYSLLDQVDWDIALRKKRGTVNPLGLYDLDRNIRPVGMACKQLMRDWGEVLPTQSVCLGVPLRAPRQYGAPEAHQNRAQSQAAAHTIPTEPSNAGGA